MSQAEPTTAPPGALPDDLAQAVLVGRVWRPDRQGPAVVVPRDGQVFDITSKAAPTMAALLAMDDPAGFVAQAEGEAIGALADLMKNDADNWRQDAPWLLAPADLQAIKAAGVTFIASLLERVIEEQARGAPEKVQALRADLEKTMGTDLAALRPGSEQAMALKQTLQKRGIWSQYLEVGIGADAEIFTKGQPMSAVGTGAAIGIHPRSTWNNPEPEIALAVSPTGRVAGATLCNDVNLRDFEGRSALLLGRAKDNNASCALGPFIRLFDQAFSLDDIRKADVDLLVEGEDGFRLQGASSMARISRDPADLVRATMDENHQYPDGFVLALGTMFVPVQDRGEAGQGFTHHTGDTVTIATARLGALRNRVKPCPDCPPWTFGAGALMRNLAARGLL